MMKIHFMKVNAESAVAFAESAAALRTACQKYKAQLALVTLNGAVDALVSSALAVINTASALPVVLLDPEGREQLGQRGIAVLISILRQHPDDSATVRAGMHAARASMLVHENHRQQFVTAARLLKLVAPALKQYKEDAPTFLAVCGALRATTLADDARARTSKGLEHAKAAMELKVAPQLLDAAKGPVGQSSASA